MRNGEGMKIIQGCVIGANLCIVALAHGAMAQAVTGSGSLGMVPVFTGSSAVGNSPISVLRGNVGIGMMNPGASLDVQSINGGNIYRASDSDGQVSVESRSILWNVSHKC